MVCGYSGGCSCVSDPRCIQFALISCYAVHINALSISPMKMYIEGITCKLK